MTITKWVNKWHKVALDPASNVVHNKHLSGRKAERLHSDPVGHGRREL